MEKLKKGFGFVAIFFFMLTLAIAVTINFTPLYAFDVSYLDVENMTGLSKEVILENYQILMNYLNIPWVGELAMPDFPSSANGLFHFHEVKRLFMLNYGVLLVSGIATFFFLHNKKKERKVWQLIGPTQIMAVIPIVLLFLVAINFDRLFIVFHELFFNNDAWIFNWQTDPIILALPQEFFMHCFILVFVLLEVGLWLLYFWAKKTMKKS